MSLVFSLLPCVKPPQHMSFIRAHNARFVCDHPYMVKADLDHSHLAFRPADPIRPTCVCNARLLCWDQTYFPFVSCPALCIQAMGSLSEVNGF